jgi:hypothetical protein
VADRIDPALAEKIKSGVPEINVEVEFSTAPPAGQLQALGLKGEGNVAWGLLSRDKIQAIAAVPQVVAIRLSQRPAEPKTVRPAGERIRPALALELQLKPNERHHVLVTFQRPPQNLPDLKDLAVQGTSGDGQLSRQEIETLARCDDVLKIDLFPEVKLY